MIRLIIEGKIKASHAERRSVFFLRMMCARVNDLGVEAWPCGLHENRLIPIFAG